MKKTKWEPFTIDSIFTIGNGIRLTKSDMTEGPTPFVGATDSNNGITAFCGNINNSADSNVLGVNYNGSVAECFYHPYLSLFSDDVKRLHLKDAKDNKYVYLFIKVAILKQKKKYEYGYKFNAERMAKQKISLPVKAPGVPDYAFMERYMKKIESKLFSNVKNFLDKEDTNPITFESYHLKYNDFYIKDLFDYQKGNQNNMNSLHDGNTPLISAKNRDNGFNRFVNSEGSKIYKGHCITLNLDGDGGAGMAYYQPYEMAIDSHVAALVPKSVMSNYVLQYIAASITKQGSQFHHGHSINKSRFNSMRAILPCRKNGEPDYDYMESYMRAMETKLLRRYINSRLADISKENE